MQIGKDNWNNDLYSLEYHISMRSKYELCIGQLLPFASLTFMLTIVDFHFSHEHYVGYTRSIGLDSNVFMFCYMLTNS